MSDEETQRLVRRLVQDETLGEDDIQTLQRQLAEQGIHFDKAQLRGLPHQIRQYQGGHSGRHPGQSSVLAKVFVVIVKLILSSAIVLAAIEGYSTLETYAPHPEIFGAYGPYLIPAAGALCALIAWSIWLGWTNKYESVRYFNLTITILLASGSSETYTGWIGVVAFGLAALAILTGAGRQRVPGEPWSARVSRLIHEEYTRRAAGREQRHQAKREGEKRFLTYDERRRIRTAMSERGHTLSSDEEQALDLMLVHPDEIARLLSQTSQSSQSSGCIEMFVSLFWYVVFAVGLVSVIVWLFNPAHYTPNGSEGYGIWLLGIIAVAVVTTVTRLSWRFLVFVWIFFVAVMRA